VTTAEAAALLGLTTDHIARLVAQGRIAGWQAVPGRSHWLLDDDSVLAYAQALDRPCAACGRRLPPTALAPLDGPRYCGSACESRARRRRAAGLLPTSPTVYSVATWTRDSVLAAIRRWAAEWGEAPTCSEWGGKPPRATAYRCAGPRYWPSVPTVARLFGTWRAAIVAAGVPPRDHSHLPSVPPFDRARPRQPCGTEAAYRRGCRCDACRVASREGWREQARRRRAQAARAEGGRAA
jgi:excisionase family DNA binding protein